MRSGGAVAAVAVVTLALLVAAARAQRTDDSFSGGDGAVDSPFTISDAIMGNGTAAELHMKMLTNTATGESVTVIWEAGGRVEQLLLRSVSDPSAPLRDVLVGHNGDAVAVRENLRWKGCLLAPFVNRIANGTYEFEGVTHYLPRNEVVGRVDALHGWLCNRSLEVLSQSVTPDAASLTLFYAFTGADVGYPFAFDLSVVYTLTADHRFTIALYVFNTMLSAGQAFPWTVGWHPYFRVGDVSAAYVVLDTCVGWNEVLMTPGAPRSGLLLPTGRMRPMSGLDGALPIGGTPSDPTYYDTEFKATRGLDDCADGVISQQIVDPNTPSAAVAGGVTSQTVTLFQDRNFRGAQLFTGSMANWGDSAIALEPMSGLADAFNQHNMLSIIDAGEEWDGTFGVFVN